MTVIGRKIKKVYKGDTQIRPSYKTTSDVTTFASANTFSNTNYLYGVNFTALKDGFIKRVDFRGYMTGKLIIIQGDYASDTGKPTSSYNISGVISYTLPTPYEIKKGYNYVVMFKMSSGYCYQYTSMSYPVTRTAVTFNRGTFSNGINRRMTDRVYNIQTLVIDYED